MSTEVTFVTGVQPYSADSLSVRPRLGRQGDVVTSDGHGRYYEPNYRSTLGEASAFSCSTGTAGVAPGTVLSTTPPFILWNPPGSGKNLWVIKTIMGYVSGTLGAGQLWYGKVNVQDNQPTTGTVLVPVSTVCGIASGGVGQCFQGSTLATLPSIIRPAPFSWGAYVGTAAVLNNVWLEELAGGIMVAPGAAFIMQAVAAAGTAPLALFGADWGEEKV